MESGERDWLIGEFVANNWRMGCVRVVAKSERGCFRDGLIGEWRVGCKRDWLIGEFVANNWRMGCVRVVAKSERGCFRD